MTKFNRDYFERLLAMADDNGETWDFSEEDTKALQWVLRRLDYFASWEKVFLDALVKIRDLPEANCERYVSLVDEIVCEILAKKEGGIFPSTVAQRIEAIKGEFNARKILDESGILMYPQTYKDEDTFLGNMFKGKDVA